jgi:hypothetical protein
MNYYYDEDESMLTPCDKYIAQERYQDYRTEDDHYPNTLDEVVFVNLDVTSKPDYLCELDNDRTIIF